MHIDNAADQGHPYRPAPNPATGELVVDPEIALKAKAFGVAISYFYSSLSDYDAQYGVGRSASVDGHVQSQIGGNSVTIVRGDFKAYAFSLVGTSGGVTTYVGETQPYSNTTITYDSSGFSERFTDGSILKYQDQLSVGSGTASHPIVAARDARGVTHTYQYDVYSSTANLRAIQISTGQLVSFVYATGSPTSLLSAVQDWGGRRWTFQYDSQRYLTTITSPQGCMTGYQYSLAGGPVTLLSQITDPRGYATSYLYDSRRRAVTMTAGGANWIWDYSTTGRTVHTSPAGGVRTMQYDAEGNILFDSLPEGYTVFNEYSNRLLSRAHYPYGTLTSVTYDSLGRRTASDDALGNRTTWLYDAAGNPTTMIDALGYVWTSIFEGSGATMLLSANVDPLGRRTSYTYTPDGLPLTKQDARGSGYH